jgi:hypothetical protein
MDLCHPEVEFAPLAGAGDRYTGRDGVAKFFQEVRVEEMEVDTVPHVFRDEGNRVIVLGRVRVWSGGGLSDSPAVWCLEIEDGLIRKVVPHEQDRAA